jgi:hypothetical protein
MMTERSVARVDRGLPGAPRTPRSPGTASLSSHRRPYAVSWFGHRYPLGMRQNTGVGRWGTSLGVGTSVASHCREPWQNVGKVLLSGSMGPADSVRREPPQLLEEVLNHVDRGGAAAEWQTLPRRSVRQALPQLVAEVEDHMKLGGHAFCKAEGRRDHHEERSVWAHIVRAGPRPQEASSLDQWRRAADPEVVTHRHVHRHDRGASGFVARTQRRS